MELEKKIRTYLKENGINQAFVAKLLNLSPANLGAIYKTEENVLKAINMSNWAISIYVLFMALTH